MRSMLKCLLFVGVCVVGVALQARVAVADEVEAVLQQGYAKKANFVENEAVIQKGNYNYQYQGEYVGVYQEPPYKIALYCGDGSVNTAVEQCDDGNNADGDACSAKCQIEVPPDTNPDCYDTQKGDCEQAKENCLSEKGNDCYAAFHECLVSAIETCQPHEDPQDPQTPPPPVKPPKVKKDVPLAPPARIGVGMSGSGCTLGLGGGTWSLEEFIWGLGFIAPLLRFRRRR